MLGVPGKLHAGGNERSTDAPGRSFGLLFPRVFLSDVPAGEVGVHWKQGTSTHAYGSIRTRLENQDRIVLRKTAGLRHRIERDSTSQEDHAMYKPTTTQTHTVSRVTRRGTAFSLDSILGLDRRSCYPSFPVS